MLRGLFHTIRNSAKTKDFLVFLVFVAIAAVFWVIMALNDDTQSAYDVPLRIGEVPDSVTFISPVPERVRVSVRDRGINLARLGFTGVPALELDFREFSEGDVFRVSHASLSASLRRIFGSSATVSAVTPDSLRLVFTSLPGRRLPVVLDYDVTVAPGMVLGEPKVSPSVADVFSTGRSDTLRRLFTDRVVLRDVDRTVTVSVPLEQLPGKRVEPASVDVTFVVEQLVRKEAEVSVEADNIPLGQDILFFPSKVPVAYYVPMSRYADAQPVRVQASFAEAVNTSSDKVAVHVVSAAPYMSNVELLLDSVEYTLVRSN